ncbi:MAG: sugar transferase [Caulobacteraceae bacterium]
MALFELVSSDDSGRARPAGVAAVAFAPPDRLERPQAASETSSFQRRAPKAGGRGSDLACRGLDITLAALMILFLAPLLLLLAVLVQLQDGGPALFAQQRVGRGGRMFGCLKFRTMVIDADDRLAALLHANPSVRSEWETDHKLRVDPRVTPLGRFLRLSSLDELPQLFNVLRGEMSLVGPRPIVAAEVHRYRRFYAQYCSVAPGITGLWQISGRNDVDYKRRVVMDVAYVRRRSFALNCSIIAGTIPALLARRGAY